MPRPRQQFYNIPIKHRGISPIFLLHQHRFFSSISIRMRKTFAIFLLLSLAHISAYAYSSWEACILLATGDLCPAGCGKNDATSECMPCQQGTYNDQSNSSGDAWGNNYACKSCGNLPYTVENDSRYISIPQWSHSTGATSLSECTYQTACAAGHYFAGHTLGCQYCGDEYITSYQYSIATNMGTYYDSNAEKQEHCKQCGDNSHPNDEKTECDCNEKWQAKIDTNIANSGCSPKEFQIKLQNTGGGLQALNIYDKQGENIGQKCTAGTGCYIKTPTETVTGHTFDSWAYTTTTINNNGETVILRGNITHANGYSLDMSQIEYGNDVVVTENWTPNRITIFYQTKNHPTGAIITATDKYDYGTEEYNLKAPDEIWGKEVIPKGQFFATWTCTTVDKDNKPIKEEGDCGTFDEGTNISKEFESGYVRMTANYAPNTIDCGSGYYLHAGSEVCEKCLAGYYCKDEKLTYNEEKDSGLYPCPAGSTSAAGSNAITNCYMTTETKICDTNQNCIQIPEETIYYKEQQP